MTHQFNILKKNRQTILKIIAPFSLEQLNKVPIGHKNNIAWNVAHLVVTQQLLCYNLSRLPMLVSDNLVSRFRKGTKTEGPVSPQEFEEIKELLISLPNRFEKDYNNGIFNNYDAYTTSLDVTLTDIETAFAFNNFHEGIHLGVILAQRKLI